MTEKDVSQGFRLKKIKEMNNHFIKEIDQNELLRNKNKKVCTTLNYIEHSLTLFLAVTVCISISGFASSVNISKGIMNFTIGVNSCANIGRIKKYKSIIKKKKKNHDEISLLAKANLDFIKGSISKSLIDLYIECDYFLLIDVLREYDGMKEKINKLEIS